MHDLLIMLRIREMQDMLRACQDIFSQEIVSFLRLEDINSRYVDTMEDMSYS